jgi:hypothetical protein
MTDSENAGAAIAGSLFFFMRTVVHLWCGDGESSRAMLKSGRDVHGIEPDAEKARRAEHVTGQPVSTRPFDEMAALSSAAADTIVATPPPGTPPETVLSVLRDALPILHPDGMLYVFTGDNVLRAEIAAVLPAWELAEYPARGPRPESRYTMIAEHRKCVDLSGGRALMAVRAAYDPLKHGQRLFAEGNPEWGFEVLDFIPADRLGDPVYQLMVAMEMQIDLLSWRKDLPPRPALKRFYQAQQQFYNIMNLHPRNETAFACQAEFWRLIGDNNMARRLLTNFYHAEPAPGIARRLAAMPAAPRRPEEEAPPPAYDPGFRPRLLLINHANCDCGFDAIYDGLCRVTGAENNIEWPFKPFLHGAPIGEGIHHPSMCDHPGEARSAAELEAELREGRFDAIVFSDVFVLNDRAETLRLIGAAPDLPLFVLDTQDEGFNNLPRLLVYLERDHAAGHFKREMLACADYGPDTWPLPLAYSDSRAAPAFNPDRCRDIFWAGHRHFGLRRLYLDTLEEKLGRDFSRILPPEEYVRALDTSRIGLDFFGLGFDTVRYYELAAHGCMVLSERKPIRIPHNFREGESAVFFDDLADLERKLGYYRNQPAETQAIAEAGYRHMRQYHTASARAAQFLARMKGRM